MFLCGPGHVPSPGLPSLRVSRPRSYGRRIRVAASRFLDRIGAASFSVCLCPACSAGSQNGPWRMLLPGDGWPDLPPVVGQYLRRWYSFPAHTLGAAWSETGRPHREVDGCGWTHCDVDSRWKGQKKAKTASRVSDCFAKLDGKQGSASRLQGTAQGYMIKDCPQKVDQEGIPRCLASLS